MSTSDLYRRWIDELWCGRTEVVDDLIGEGFVGHWPDRTVRGPDELAALISETHAMLEPLSFGIEVGPIVQDDLVAGRWRGTGRQSGAAVHVVGNDLLRVEGGRFVEYWVASMPVT